MPTAGRKTIYRKRSTLELWMAYSWIEANGRRRWVNSWYQCATPRTAQKLYVRYIGLLMLALQFLIVKPERTKNLKKEI